MRKKCKFILLICAICTVFLYSGCGKNEEDGPKEIVQKYFNAVKAGDIDGAIECFTPAFQQQYSSAVSLGGILGQFLTGIDGSSLLEGFMSFANQYTYKDCKFIIGEVEFTDDEHEHATVHVSVEGAGDGIPDETTIGTVKYNGEWYVEP